MRLGLGVRGVGLGLGLGLGSVLGLGKVSGTSDVFARAQHNNIRSFPVGLKGERTRKHKEPIGKKGQENIRNQNQEITFQIKRQEREIKIRKKRDNIIHARVHSNDKTKTLMPNPGSGPHSHPNPNTHPPSSPSPSTSPLSSSSP